MADPLATPLVIFDGDCGYCRRWAARWRWRGGDRLAFVPRQEVGEGAGEILPEALAEAVHLREPSGRVSRGAEAVLRVHRLAGGAGLGLLAYCRVPGAAALAELAYRRGVRSRGVLEVLARIGHGGEARPSTYLLARGLFLRLLGVVYLIAIVSLWAQIDGLVGSGGILPLATFLDAVREQLGSSSWWQLPTLCWLDPGDAFLHGLCAIGVVSAALLALGVAPIPVLLVLWAVYLSLSTAGQVFLGFQWDTLLLETTLMAVFFAPPRLLMRPRGAAHPGRAGLVLVRALLFKLMFLSGITKLLSGDPTWRDATALDYHYETQPIPAWTSWYAHHWPEWWQRLSVHGMLVVEIIVPVLIVAPRRVRHGAAAALAGLQFGIAATGNFGFFNLLSVVLCVPLLDDALLRRLLPARRTAWIDAVPPPRERRWWSHARAAAAAAVLLASGLALVREMVRTQRPDTLPEAVVRALDGADAALLGWGRPAILDPIARFRTINGYGLFRVMTTDRPEIEVQGSPFALTWRTYGFRWKAGDVHRRPRFVAPYMPRLDWQMWFAALDPRGNGYWLAGLARCLLEGRPEVLRLLGENPFPDHPPRAVRFVFYRYRFTTAAERRKTGAWWKREETGRTRPITGPAARRPAPAR